LSILKPNIDKFESEKDYVATANVSGHFLKGDFEKITYHKRPSRANMQPVKNSVWFAKMVDEKKHLLILPTDDYLLDKIYSTGFMGLLPTKNLIYFVYQFIKSDEFEQLKNASSTGVVQVALQNNNFKKTELKLPPTTVLQTFNSAVEPIFSKIGFLTRENQTLASLRDKLLRRLIR
jgi:type I restriction enzyme S subunit